MKIIDTVKKLSGARIKKSVLAQKNEWPATSAPIFFQPERPKADELANREKHMKKQR